MKVLSHTADLLCPLPVEWWAGHEQLLMALASLSPTPVLAVGDRGPSVDRLRYTIADLRLDGCVRVLGSSALAELAEGAVLVATPVAPPQDGWPSMPVRGHRPAVCTDLVPLGVFGARPVITVRRRDIAPLAEAMRTAVAVPTGAT
jgi:hypothetical protein